MDCALGGENGFCAWGQTCPTNPSIEPRIDWVGSNPLGEHSRNEEMGSWNPVTSTKPATGFRWTVCALIFFATTANYLDRAGGPIVELNGADAAKYRGPTTAEVTDAFATRS